MLNMVTGFFLFFLVFATAVVIDAVAKRVMVFSGTTVAPEDQEYFFIKVVVWVVFLTLASISFYLTGEVVWGVIALGLLFGILTLIVFMEG